MVANLAAALAAAVVLLWNPDMDYAIEWITFVKQAHGLTEAVLESHTTQMWWGCITTVSYCKMRFYTTICWFAVECMYWVGIVVWIQRGQMSGEEG